MTTDLRSELEAAAKASERSLNAEIVHRLTQSLDDELPMTRDGYYGPLTEDDLRAIMQKLERQRLKLDSMQFEHQQLQESLLHMIDGLKK